MKKLTREEFIIKSIRIHGDKYDYSLVDYINARTKVKIICPIHGVFEQNANSHLNGHNCYFCGLKTTSIKCSMELEKFIEKSNEIHGDKYDYNLVDYINSKTKVKIICPIHGIFEQIPNCHLIGQGCTKCGIEKNKVINRKNIKDFIEESNEIHNSKYDYSLVEYKNNRTKVKIICTEHGIFEQTPSKHSYGQGCPFCKTKSKGEEIISNILNNEKIIFINQKRFDDCRNIYPLPFDFYLPELNTCIEFDGIQHFKPIKYWGGEKSLISNKKKDKIKTEYCKNNNIQLIRIKHDEDINEKLSNLI